MLNERRTSWLAAAALVWVTACSDDQTVTPPADTGPDADVTGCDEVLSATGDDYTAVQEAFINTPADSTICFMPGTYVFDQELSLTTRGITIRGVAEGIIFDFSTQEGAASAVLVTGNDFTIDNVSIRNSPGDGIHVEGAENLVFRNLDVRWDGEPRAENGGYAVFPVGSTNVLIEDTEVFGASDAGLYVGQSHNVIVRNNTVHGNVAGIEIENSTDAEVYGNHVYDNTGGVLVFNLPNLAVQDGRRTRIYDNVVEDNNRENFAPEGNIVAVVPTGTGIMIISADEIEVTGNTIRDQDSFGILLVSYLTGQLLGLSAPDDPNYDEYPETIWIHDNTYSSNGQTPRDDMDLLLGVETLETIVWDGFVDDEKDNSDGSLDLCIDEAEDVTFRNLDVPGNLENPSTDISAHACEHDSLPPLDLSF